MSRAHDAPTIVARREGVGMRAGGSRATRVRCAQIIVRGGVTNGARYRTNRAPRKSRCDRDAYSMPL